MSTNKGELEKERNEKRSNDQTRQMSVQRNRKKPAERSRLRTGKSSHNSGNNNQLATGLGWFSLALGLSELLAPRAIAKIAGIPTGHHNLIRLYGARELASGLGIFAQQMPAEALWSRVAGDAVDLASLGAVFASPKANKRRVAFATASVLGVTALDLMAAQRMSRQKGLIDEDGAVRAHKSIVVNRPREEVYQFWHDFQNLPRFMRHLESVRLSGDRRSHWVAKAPGGGTVEWDAELTEDKPNETIAWRSLEGSEIENHGSVRFEETPGQRGTLVKVEIAYYPPGGLLGAAIAKLFGEEPDQQLQDDLRRFKQVMEVGEVVISDATLLGTGLTEQRPGQPAALNETREEELPPKAAAAKV